MWIPDLRTPEFAAEAHRQSVAVAVAARTSDDQDFVEAVTAPWELRGMAR